LPSKEQRIAEVEKLLADPAVWEEKEKGTVLAQELTELKKEIGEVKGLKGKFADILELTELLHGRTNINSFSIGIELINTEIVGPNETQYSSLVGLIKSLESKYRIKSILGHNEISPERKTDPWNFDWQRFNEMLKN